MKILVVGAGKMGSWLIESLCLDYEVAAYDNDLTRLRYFFNTVKAGVTMKRSGISIPIWSSMR